MIWRLWEGSSLQSPYSGVGLPERGAHYLLSCFSHVRLCDPRDGSLPAPLSMGFSRQEYWSGLPFPTPGDLPNPGTGAVSKMRDSHVKSLPLPWQTMPQFPPCSPYPIARSNDLSHFAEEETETRGGGCIQRCEWGGGPYRALPASVAMRLPGPAAELAGALPGRQGRLFFFQSFKKHFWPLCSIFKKLRSWHPIPSLHGK